MTDQLSPDAREVRYQVNARDEIVFVNDAWDAFAEAHGGEGVTSPHIVRRSLWDFIADGTTRLLYRDIMTRARKGRPVEFTLRCDSPDCRRYLQMNVSGGVNQRVDFRVTTLAVEPRAPQPLLDRATARHDTLVRLCGWCKKVEVNGEWREVEEAVVRLRLLEQSSLPATTHGMCESCYAAISDLLRTQH